jgi:3-hydroxyacyl-CoA dehydrogenase/enoyl-CoA hydratase/3-hydroxybutyryl-CoA epimerase
MEFNNLHLEDAADGVVLVTLDMPGRPFNVFSEDMIDELEALIDTLAARADSWRGVVITSGKNAFMAGADLAMVEGFTTLRHRAAPDAIRATFSRLSYLLRRLERLPQTLVAAVDGLALGGGLELAMACHHRVAAIGDKPSLGLPEVLLGLLPGAGGTQRLPRLTAPAFAARMLLSGAPVTPQTALDSGLVDRLVPAEALVASAVEMAQHSAPGARWDQPGWTPPADPTGLLDGADAEAALLQSGWTDPAVAHCYPALRAIVNCIREGRGRDFDAAMELEFDQFLGLMLDPVAGNMVNTGFLAKTAAVRRARERLGEATHQPARIALTCAGPVPARLASRLEVVNSADADLHLGLREVTSEADSGCAVEARYAGDFARAQAVELAAAPGESAAQAVAALSRVGLIPIAVSRTDSGPATRLLQAARRWLTEHAASDEQRAQIATAIDGAAFFAAAGLKTHHTASFEASDHERGLALLAAVAAEAAACVREGLVVAAQDLDVLAVFVLGFPAWTGGPLRLLEDARRGDVPGLTLPAH